MSWLKEKIFGKKPGQTSLGASLDSDEGDREQSMTNSHFCKGQLKNFLDRKEKLKVSIMGWEIVAEVLSPSPRANTSSTGWLSVLWVKSTRSAEDTASSGVSTNTPVRTTVFIITSVSQVCFSDPDKSLNLLTGFSDQQLVQSRVKVFGEMLECLVGGLASMPDTLFLEWLELDKQLFVPLSPIPVSSRRKLIRSFMETSSIDQSIFSEETKKLKELLFHLSSGVDSTSGLKDIEEYLFSPDNRKKFKLDEVSKPVVTRPLLAGRR